MQKLFHNFNWHLVILHKMTTILIKISSGDHKSNSFWHYAHKPHIFISLKTSTPTAIAYFSTFCNRYGAIIYFSILFYEPPLCEIGRFIIHNRVIWKKSPFQTWFEILLSNNSILKFNATKFLIMLGAG